ncbi:MAG: DUF3887 domain-containing protein [Dictyoglomus turgidum]
MRKILIIFLMALLFTIIYAQEDEKAISEKFIYLLVSGRYEEARDFFDPSVKSMISVEKLEELWKSLEKQVGDFRSILGYRTEGSGVYRIVFVTCEFNLMDVDIRLVFANKKIVGMFFQPAPPRKSYTPPSYVDVNSFVEKDIKIGKEFSLPGKLVIPKGKGPFPVVILVHGSGPNDMDETIGPNKPFRDIAWGLGTLGIATLRYDKRTKIYPEKFSEYKDGFTVWEEVIEDVLFVIEFLKTQEEIDSNKIFILGHSLGGMLAPRIATYTKDVTGLIIMAGPTRSLEDLILAQTEYLFGIDGTIDEKEKAQLEIIKGEIQKIKDPDVSKKYPLSFMILGAPVKYWADLKSYDPVLTLSSLEIPALILQGERDYQVTLKDFEGWSKLSPFERITLKTYPKLNHLFMEGEEKSIPQEYYVESHIPEYVIKDIANWIKSF